MSHLALPDAETATAGTPARAGSPAMQATGVGKTYGVVQALSGIDLAIEAGTIHSLVGANGAGKSTFLGCIAGRVTPSAGDITVFGQPHVYGDPHFAHQAGIATVFQELTIVPAMSALENVFLGRAPSLGGLVPFKAMRRTYDALCDRFNVSIPWNAAAGSLSVADQQMLEIMRCVHSDARIFLFDEPTTSLALPERQSLFAVMRQLRASGKAVVIVSHALEEVLEISDVITVFRDGKLSRHAPCESWTERSLVEAMLGHYASVERRVRPLAEDAPEKLKIEGLTVDHGSQDVTIHVRRGEIVGIAGLVGSGRSSILKALVGQRRATGKIVIDGTAGLVPRRPREALERGIALIPEDRKTEGLILDMSVSDNIIGTNFSKVSQGGVISKRRTLDLLGPVVRRYGFDPARLGTPVRLLSGGNQQKVMFSKWDYKGPSILLIDEPTRGVDVGAKSEILHTLQELAGEGLSILMVSSELEEIAAICNTIYTISAGRITGRIDNDRDHVDADAILEKLFEVKP
ncbi:sugar ABC transporter ATP-binding protein [Leisingera daeponensis]|uniref:sugar ABC transporter ATP-binding protein n=1 Tax=Leisingera daeponensis TaxID=405746 RepID=UPI001C9499B7|nr:sugar ABC transporter ATP-binding protein [Leisingera daeponensis]MBY6059282.1 sugar ABC transporter ATP-binding protein [Leisingera daeponensis]